MAFRIPSSPEAERVADVKLLDVRKAFKDAVVVGQLNLEVSEGEFLVLVGPSGCGKSTTLNMIAGLEELTSGQIFIGGADVTHEPPKNRDIAMVFQSYALYPHMSVAQNLGFGLKVRGTPRKEIEVRVLEIARALQLEALLSRKPRELSGGQRQRVALGRAMVRRPGVFLFDEPLSNLDAKLRMQMRIELKQLHRRLRTTTIYVTHDQVEAMTLGTRLVIMNHGSIQQMGAPLDLYQQPNNRFVAQFLGSPAMNLWTGTIGANGREMHIDDRGWALPLSDAALLHVTQHRADRVTAGIRAEHVAVGQESPASGSPSLPGEIVVIEALGHQSFAVINGERASITALLPPGPWNVGDRVRAIIDPGRLMYFDVAAGENRIA